MDTRSSPKVTRRRAFLGIAASAAAIKGVFTPGEASAQPLGAAPELRGTEFDLRVSETQVNVTGRQRPAIAINGSIPAPTLRWREGTTVTIRVTNALPQSTSIHWHGILLPFEMDGVPGISFRGIAPGQTFTYRFDVKQSGTYWYHSHSAFQEQLGHYGAIIIDPATPDPVRADRDYVVFLSDWTDEVPERVFEKLKAVSDYYNYQVPTVGDFFRDVAQIGMSAALERRREWNRMRMNPTDLIDVSSATYTYLMNGLAPASNWFGVARQGERVRLRFINGSASSIFDVRIPGLKMTVVSTDGQPVHPVEVDEMRISTAETYDVVVMLAENRPYTIFAQSIDRMGYARGTLGPVPGQQAEVPPLDPRTWLTMEDMGMAHDMGNMQGMQGMQGHAMPAAAPPAARPGASNPHAGHTMPSPPVAVPTPAPAGDHAGHSMPPAAAPSAPVAPAAPVHDMSRMQPPTTPAGSAARAPMAGMDHSQMDTGPAVDNRSMDPQPVVTDPGPRLRNNGRRVLTYSDLRTVGGPIDPRPPSREIVLRLTGNMRRFIWGFDGKKFSQAEPIRLIYGERVRITLINDTMMSHPIHLHGMWSEVEAAEGGFIVRKHTVNVHPGKRLSYLVTADAPGEWAYHCHLLYHMEAGMFRKVVVA